MNRANTTSMHGGAGAPRAIPSVVEQGPVGTWLGELLQQLHALDVAVYEAIAETPTPILDARLRQVSNTANNSLLWLGIAAILITRRGHARDAAIEGLAAVALTSAAVNQGVKRLAQRDRPERDRSGVPEVRQVRMPASTSFPSGHSASAFAFASAVSDEVPALGAPMHALAAVVAYSRIHTGVHYPGDVVAGSLIGLMVGNAVPAAVRWWRRHHRGD